tara:strand:+ start:1800 stop:2399 length:600 start_codon:yes stop_codon:yes gene_type:complete
MNESISLIVGLGNPENEYLNTRHNIGFNFVNYLSEYYKKGFLVEKRFESEIIDISIESKKVFLIKPLNYVNNSGKSVSLFSNYYKIKPENILVAHDDLDLIPGISKLKFSGGHGGHNGVRDIINYIGKDFWRLKIGIGHPGYGNKDKVTKHVLGKLKKEEIFAINNSIENSVSALCKFLTKGSEYAIKELHNIKLKIDT